MIIITLDQREAVIDSLRAGVALEAACKAARTTVANVRAFAADEPTWGVALAAAEAECAKVANSAEWEKAFAHSASLVVDVAPQVALECPGSYEEIAAEALKFAPGPFGFFLRLDARCIAHGMPPVSPWWRYSVGDFYASGKTWGIFEVGRGGGKSTTLERLAASEARYTERKVPPGQVWTMPFISVGPDDANRRINGIAAVFRADGMAIVGDDDGSGNKAKTGVKITRAPRGAMDLLDVRGNEIKLGSIAGTVGNTSGPSTIGIVIDEAAKLLDSATGANPLTEIIASLGQTSRGRMGWRAIVCSSAWERSGAHFDLIEQGDNDVTWVAKIGAPFLDQALAGFESVAAWEETRGREDAAKTIREHAATLTASSPQIPTWLGNPTLGNPLEQPWDGAALASRMLVEVLPEKALGGVPRISFWLRENGSVPLSVGEDTGADARAQILGIRDRMVERGAREGQLRRGPSTDGTHRGARRAMPWRSGGGSLG